MAAAVTARPTHDATARASAPSIASRSRRSGHSSFLAPPRSICLVAPFAFAIFINTQSSVPADSLFGRWVQSSGFAIPFVLLGFAGIAGFPLIASVVAGDIFASEDRQSTWKTVLTRSCSRGERVRGQDARGLTLLDRDGGAARGEQHGRRARRRRASAAGRALRARSLDPGDATGDDRRELRARAAADARIHLRRHLLLRRDPQQHGGGARPAGRRAADGAPVAHGQRGHRPVDAAHHPVRGVARAADRADLEKADLDRRVRLCRVLVPLR